MFAVNNAVNICTKFWFLIQIYIMCQNLDLTLVPFRYTGHAQNTKGLV